MRKRRPQEYVDMIMVIGAFLVLGRRRSFDPFNLVIVIAGAAVGFRFQRDAWIAMLPAIAVHSYGLPAEPGERESPRKTLGREGNWAGALAVVVLIIAAARLPDQNTLMSKVGRNFPVKACDY